MQLTVRDVSRFLNVSESTVPRWIKQRGLPSEYVGGQYRFNRVELLEWATANQIKVSVDVFDQLEDEDEPGPSLVEALEDGLRPFRLRGRRLPFARLQARRRPAQVVNSSAERVLRISVGPSHPFRAMPIP